MYIYSYCRAVNKLRVIKSLHSAGASQSQSNWLTAPPRSNLSSCPTVLLAICTLQLRLKGATYFQASLNYPRMANNAGSTVGCPGENSTWGLGRGLSSKDGLLLLLLLLYINIYAN